MCLLMSIHGPSASTAFTRLLLQPPDGIPGDLDYYIVSPYEPEELPLLRAASPTTVTLASWGLIPPWAKDEADAKSRGKRNANARSETMFELPSFRASARRDRCIIPADGFFEFHHHGGAAYPFYCSLAGGRPFFFAGLHSLWKSPQTQAISSSFSVVTTRANRLMTIIHNKSPRPEERRMPVVLSDDEARLWLDQGASIEAIREVARTRDVPGLRAHSVSREMNSPARRRNAAEVQALVEYPEIRETVAQIEAAQA